MKNYHIYLVLTGVMLIWGLNVSVLKILVEHFMPVTITALRIFTAGVCVLLILAISQKIRKPSSQELGYIIVGGLLNVVAHHLFLATGLARTTATNGGLILGLGPLITACFALIFLKRFPTRLQLIGFVLGGIGISFTVLAGNKEIGDINLGDFYVFLSILAQGMSFILIKKASTTLDPRLLTGYMLIIGSFILFLLSIVIEPDGLKTLGGAPAYVWGVFFASAILATALGHYIYNYAIGQTGPAEAAIFLNLSTFFALLGSAVFLGEQFYPSHFAGLILIVSGVVFGSGAMEDLIRKRRRRIKVS
ncbi:DMT family transporter [Bacillus canaveralius]|uniref:DMT family transporter n=1 Tax=Bacillus canaveralius TaxID=1403243 RepID=UPI000F77F594|nr:DMT family transporter [Bacillus canaveralius]RSK50680.1 DMT family transporter [Bacillus canaveralius]